MKKDFIEKLRKEGIVDTKTYRYNLIDTGHGIYIERIRREYLGTTAAINGWEVVHDERMKEADNEN